MRLFVACAVGVLSVGLSMSFSSDGTPTANAAAAGLPAVVCGASFRALPLRWHQSGAPSTPIIGGEVPGNTWSWAATPPSVGNLVKSLPRDGIYIWVDLIRPKRGPTGTALRLPLLLRKAKVIEQEGAPHLPEYRIEGRYRRQYVVVLGVDFGRSSPPARLRRLAERVLRTLVLPRWVPFARRSSC
ncbi:MAG TPA: hypothetical protein VFU30_10130 [Gaiellaceae bacterium]|nr:hypothetical protein [Gaiellaceae bacterium]